VSANNKQVGGKHYSKYGNLQPWDVVIACRSFVLSVLQKYTTPQNMGQKV